MFYYTLCYVVIENFDLSKLKIVKTEKLLVKKYSISYNGLSLLTIQNINTVTEVPGK